MARRRTYPVLLSQLRWFIRLRWIAGATVMVLSLADILWLSWYAHDVPMLAIGAGILFYNLCMVFALGPRATASPVKLLTLAWAQIALDLACLTVLLTWTGGVDSPLKGLYVFHMIFASLLLSRRMAYAAAALAVSLAAAGSWATGTWPDGVNDWRLVAGWVVTLVLTVYLTNRITRGLRRQRQRLLHQNRDIRRLARKLHRQQETLVQQEKMAALGQMAAGITHEIANPLASMDSLLQLLQRKPERATADSMEKLRTQVTRINQIVRQMAAFAHPGEGQWETLPVNEVVATAMEMVRFDKRLANVQVQLNLDPSAGRARVVPQAMNQVIINLAANALDAMAETPAPTLEVSTRHSEGACEIRVRDNGHGIRPEHMSRIFEPFFTTKPVGKGTGVGLSITYSLVRKQHGEIAVSSRPGQGATFTVRLPEVH